MKPQAERRNKTLRATTALAIALSIGVSAATAVRADEISDFYTGKQVTMLVGFGVGGGGDTYARLLARHIGDFIPGKPTLVVQNMPGGGGLVATNHLYNAAAQDGTVIMSMLSPTVLEPLMGNKNAGMLRVFAHDPQGQAALREKLEAPSLYDEFLRYLARWGHAVPARNLKELLALAKQKPAALSYASPGAGSQAHLAGELLELSAGVHMLHVPYRGIAPAVNDLVGGQVSMMFAPFQTALPHIRSGKLRAIGVASLKRSHVMPELPTIAEQGVPKFEAVSWYALMAPAGTPADIVEKLSAEGTRVLARRDIREKLAAQGMEAAGGSAQQLASTVQAESQRWAEVIRKQNIKPE